MADNVAITPGTGATIAADDIGGVLYPRGKTGFGVDGSYVDVSASNPLPASLASLPLPDGAATEAGLAAIGVLLSGTLTVAVAALPAGLATSALQDTANSSLASLDGKTPPLGQALTGASVPVVLPAAQVTSLTAPVLGAGEAHAGEVGAAGDLIDVTLSLDTLIYADGDVLADTQTVTNAVRVTGGRAILQSVVVIDEDDQGQPFDLYFFSANRSLGTENAAPSISDANARDFLGRVSVGSADYTDLGGVRVASVPGIGLLLEAAGSRDLYVGAISRGTGTYTAAGLKLRLGLLWD